VVDVRDAGSATFVYGRLKLFLDGFGKNATRYNAVPAVFPENESRIDPTIVQWAVTASCGFPCTAGAVSVPFIGSVAAGDMIVVAVDATNGARLAVSDSLRTTLTMAVSGSATNCRVLRDGLGFQPEECDAAIYWGISPASGPDTVTVTEGSSNETVEEYLYEFSGVGKVGSTVVCTADCNPVSYPYPSFLVGVSVGGGICYCNAPWSGIQGYGPAYSGLAVPQSAGSVAFPCPSVVGGCSAVSYVTVGVVLVPAPPPAASIPPWGDPGLSPYESYINNAVIYVSLGNGLVSVEQPTFDLPGRGLAVAPALLYNEPGAFWPGGNAPYQNDNFTLAFIDLGWSLNLPWLGTYAVHLANGQQYPYDWKGGADMQVHGPVDFELTSASAGGFCPCVLTLPSGIQYAFNIAKQLVQENDTTGHNGITYSYGSNGMLSSITDTVGRQIAFGYNGNQLASMTAPGGRTWAFSYTVAQLRVTDPVGRTTVFKQTLTPGGGWLVNEVDYPTGGGEVTLAYRTGMVPGGISYVAVSRDVYSAPNSLSRQDRIRYNFDNMVLVNDTLTENDGGGTAQGYITNVFSASTGIEKTYLKDSTGTTFRITESDFTSNRLTATNIEDQYGTKLAESDIRYDGWGNVIYTKNNIRHETWLSYANTNSSIEFGSTLCSASGFYSNSVLANIHDRLVGTCDFQDGSGSPQQETFYQYNTIGELTEQKISHSGSWLYTDYAHDGYGNVLSIRNANGTYIYSSYSSDYQGAYLTKKSQLANGQNITTYHAYDFNTGFTTAKTDPNSKTTSFTYDKVGRLLTATYPAVNGVIAVERQSYDDTDGIVTTTDPNGNVAKEHFDGIGRETKLERWNGTSVYSTSYYTYNWMDKIASLQTPSTAYGYTYDSVGRLLSQTNLGGTKRTVSYNDVLNFVTTKDEDGRQTFYSYDWDGRLTSVTQYSTPTQHYTTGYIYDGVGNLQSVDNNIGQITSYIYDDLNRLVRVTGPDGNYTQFGYDNLGNLIAKTTPNGAIINYKYDEASRLTSVTYPDGSYVHLTYDQDGNTLSVTSTLSGPTTDTYTYDPMNRLNGSALTISGSTYTTIFAYDKGGNLAKITYPDGLAVSMTYDAVNRLKNVGNYAAFAYNQDDTSASITFGDGEVQTYSYDSRARLSSIDDVSGNKKLMTLSYKYDNAGNIKDINSESYVYDNMSRVTSAKGGWGTQTYNYDGAGNILSSAAKGATTVYKNCGYYLNSLSGTVVQCSTDNDGNIVSKTGGWTYTYDYEGQMTTATQNGNDAQTNVYDGVGRRVEKSENETTIFTYQGVNLLFEKGIDTGTTTDHIYGNGMQLAKVKGGAIYYYHEDQVGSNRLVTYLNPKNKITAQFSSDYRPYGSNYKAKGSETFQYADRMLDSATSLYYFNARIYDPSIMRFMTTDPLAGGRSDPLTLNPYAYAGGNPVSNIDPTGLAGGGYQGIWTCQASASCSSFQSTLSPTWALLLGAAVVLTAVSIAQLGLNPVTDALAGMDLAELLSSAATIGAASQGLPLILEGTEDLSPDELAALASGRSIPEASWTKGMKPVLVGKAGEGMFGTTLSEAGINFEYQLRWRMPSGRIFKADFTIGRTPDFNGFGLDVKTSSVQWTWKTRLQIEQYKQVYGPGGFGVIFIDIPRTKVPPGLMQALEEADAFYWFE
jgi:RHS repeat-associated protein